jgi:hypothetical protein
MVAVFDRGETRFEEESTRVLKCRHRVSALYEVERWSPIRVETCCEVQSKS